MGLPISNVFIVAISSWLSKVIVVIAQFVSIKILLSGLGVNDYAAYVISMSIGGWVLLFDFGFGTALQNRISQKRAMGESYGQTLTFAFCFAFVAVLSILSIGWVTSPTIAPLLFGNSDTLSDSISAERFKTILALFGFTALGSISYKVLFAEHKGYWANIFPAIGAICGLSFVAVMLPGYQGDKVIIALILYSIPNACIAMLVFGWLLQTRWIAPRFDKELCKVAGRFWLITLMSAATLNLDYLIINRQLSPADVVIYQLVTKIYGLLYFLFSAVLAAIWPVFSEMLVKNNYKEVQVIITRYVVIAILINFVFLGLFCLFRSEIANFYFSGKAVPVLEMPFLLLVGLYNMILLVISVYTVALQSANVTKVFMLWTPVQAIISVIGQWVLAEKFGIYGIIMGLLLSYLLVPFWLIPYTFRKMLIEKSET
jgi:O-antigen/teichoic acid export membrane protein